MGISVELKAMALKFSEVEPELLEAFNSIKVKCQEKVAAIKSYKANIESRKADIAYNENKLSETGLFSFRKRRALKQQIKSDKSRIDYYKEIIKTLKAEYKQMIERRKEIVSKIRESFKENKDVIKSTIVEKIKEPIEKAKEAKDKIVEFGDNALEFGKGVAEKGKEMIEKVNEFFSKEDDGR